MNINEQIIRAINDTSSIKFLATTDKDGVPHLVAKQSIHYKDGYIVYLERLEGSKTNQNMTYSLWFDKTVAINILSSDGKSIQLKGVPRKMINAGSIFEDYYKEINSIDNGDLAAVYYIEIHTISNECLEHREMEHSIKHPLYMHIDRIAKKD